MLFYEAPCLPCLSVCLTEPFCPSTSCVLLSPSPSLRPFPLSRALSSPCSSGRTGHMAWEAYLPPGGGGGVGGHLIVTALPPGAGQQATVLGESHRADASFVQTWLDFGFLFMERWTEARPSSRCGHEASLARRVWLRSGQGARETLRRAEVSERRPRSNDKHIPSAPGLWL